MDSPTGLMKNYTHTSRIILCQYCMRLDSMLDPSSGKIVPGTKRKRNSGGNFFCPVQRVKRKYSGIMKCIIYNVEISPDWFNKVHCMDISDCLEYTTPKTNPLTILKVENIKRKSLNTLDIINILKLIFTGFSSLTFTLCFAMTNHLISTLFSVSDR